jgi:lipoate-protein ligase A
VPPRPLFDVEQFRHLAERLAVVRRVEQPTLVLGSTQRADLVDGSRAAALAVDVVHRRGGGGSVLLRPADHVWIDAWIPRGDPLWKDDVTSAAAWVGAWWSAALGEVGITGCRVHRGRSVPGEFGGLVCFAGQGPGEVFSGGRKVVGLSQWRSREGALFMACAYLKWEPGPLVELLALDIPERHALAGALSGVAVGLADLAPSGPDLPKLSQVLLTSFPTWGSDVASVPG